MTDVKAAEEVEAKRRQQQRGVAVVSKPRTLEVSAERKRQRKLPRSQNTSAKARANFLRSKRVPSYFLYRHHH
jgi:hypothetical protein